MGLLGDVLGGIGHGFQAIGSGFNSVMDRGMSNSLQAIGIDPSMLTPQQRHAMRSQFLMNLGAGIQSGTIAGGINAFQQDAQGLQQRMLAQKAQASIAQIMASGLDPEAKYRSIGDLYSQLGQGEMASKYYEVAQKMKTTAPKVHSVGWVKGPDGQPQQQAILDDSTTKTIPGTRLPTFTQVDTGSDIQFRDPNNPGATPVATVPKTVPPRPTTYDKNLFAFWAAGGGTPEEKAQGQAALAALNEPGFSEGEVAYRSVNDPDPAQRTVWKRTLALMQQSKKDNGGIMLPPPPPANVNVDRNEDWLKQLPAETQATVKAMVDGRYPVPQGRALSDPRIQSLLQAAATYEPGFDLTQWQTRLAIRRDAATGRIADNNRRLNTMIHHAGRWVDSINRLNNWLPRVGNWVGNTVKRELPGGHPALTQWGIDSAATVHEAASLVKGGTPTDQDVRAFDQYVNRDAPVQDQLAAAREVIRIGFGRLAAVQEQFQNAFHRPSDMKFLSPDSKKILETKLGMKLSDLGLENESGAPAAPGGPGAPEEWDFDSTGRLRRIR